MQGGDRADRGQGRGDRGADDAEGERGTRRRCLRLLDDDPADVALVDEALDLLQHLAAFDLDPLHGVPASILARARRSTERPGPRALATALSLPLSKT
jgi:hypothetical protein